MSSELAKAAPAPSVQETSSLLNENVQVVAASHEAADSGHGAKHRKPSKPYGYIVTICFLINYMIGVGVLELPYAFYKAGLAYAVFVIFFSGALMCTATIWIVETMTRAVGWSALAFSKEYDNFVDESARSNESASDVSDSEEQRLAVSRSAAELEEKEHETHVSRVGKVLKLPSPDVRKMIGAYTGNPSESNRGSIMYTEDGAVHTFDTMRLSYDLESEELKEVFKRTESRFFEINELLNIFAPTWATISFEVALFARMLLVLWSYGTVFGTSFTNKLPLFSWGTACNVDAYTTECAWTYRFFVLLFALVVIWTSMYEPSDMVWYHLTLTVARFLLIFIIVITSIVGMYYDKADSGSKSDTPPYVSDPRWWRWDATVTVLAAIIFAQNMSQGVPSVLSPLSEKSYARVTIVASMAITNALYLLLGVSSSLYFGDKLKSQINLNYQGYTGGLDHTEWWAYFIQYYVSLFPGIDTISLAPLLIITVGNSLRAVLLRYSKRVRKWDKKGRTLVRLCRLAGIIPSVLLALAENNLGKIITLSFIPGLWICFVAPAMLQYYSTKKCKDFGVDEKTPFSNRFLSSNVMLILVLSFAGASYGLMLWSLITGNAFHAG